MSMKTSTQMKAIGWFVETRPTLRPMLSAHPTYEFENRATGKVERYDVSHIVAVYKRALEDQRKEARKQARRSRKAES